MRLMGIIEIILSGICFGFLGIFGKKAYAAGISSGEFLSFRFLFSAMILGIFFAAFDRKKIILPKKNIFHCLLLGIFGYAVFSSCFFRALQGLSVSLTVLLLYLYPVFVSLGAVLIFKEKLSKMKLLAIPLQFIGLAIFIGVDWQKNDFTSFLFGIGSAIFLCNLYFSFQQGIKKCIGMELCILYPVRSRHSA